MTPGQQFTIAILKIVAPIITYLIGWHLQPPSYMNKGTKEEG